MSTKSNTSTSAPYKCLAPNPKSAYRQLFVKGTRIRARVLYGWYANDPNYKYNPSPKLLSAQEITRIHRRAPREEQCAELIALTMSSYVSPRPSNLDRTAQRPRAGLLT